MNHLNYNAKRHHLQYSMQQLQYISAILKEKLVSSGMSLEEQNKMIILELSMKDRLFEK